MATLVVLPLTSSANDDDNYRPQPGVATYMLAANDAHVSFFTLAEIDGSMVLTLVAGPAIGDFVENDDD